MLEIKMPKGNIQLCHIQLDKDLTYNEIYFTVKKDFDKEEKSFLFQKKLTTGGITKDTTTPGLYHFSINPEDTENLDFDKTYAFDILVVCTAAKIKHTEIGLLKLEKIVTFKNNE